MKKLKHYVEEAEKGKFLSANYSSAAFEREGMIEMLNDQAEKIDVLEAFLDLASKKFATLEKMPKAKKTVNAKTELDEAMDEMIEEDVNTNKLLEKAVKGALRLIEDDDYTFSEAYKMMMQIINKAKADERQDTKDEILDNLAAIAEGEIDEVDCPCINCAINKLYTENLVC